VDWAVIHDLNELMRTQDVVEDSVVVFASAAVVVYALATIALWFVSRPSGVQRLRLACTAALGSAALGLLANQLIGQLWFRDRPYVDHPKSLVVFTAHSHDASFPATTRRLRSQPRSPSSSSTAASARPSSSPRRPSGSHASCSGCITRPTSSPER
jgi:hypothetical protein